MKNFVISLTSNTERRHHIETEFQKNNVEFCFFDAFTPDTAIPYAQSLGLDSSDLTPVELACMMSHIAIWQKIIDENINYTVIFEDDVYLGDDAETLLSNSEWIKADWNIIKIEHFYKKIFLSSKTHHILPRKRYRYIAQLKSKNLGAAGYILSLQGAKTLLKYVLRSEIRPIDEIIFNAFIIKDKEPVFQMVPALCAQEMTIKETQEYLSLPSSLEEDRKIRQNKENKESKVGKTASFKIRREVNRVFFQTKKSLFAKKVTFR